MTLGEILLSALTGPLTAVLKDQFVNLLDKFHEEKPKEYKASLTAIYPIVDLYLEDLAKKSKTKIDDSAVLGLKEAIEESAAKNGIVLSNLDND